MSGIFEESQRERDEELARYLGIPIDGVESCEIEQQFGPPVYDGIDFRAKSYCHLYERYGKDNPATVLRALSMFNTVKRKRLIYGAQRWIGDPRGKQMLDFGCGPGGHGIHFLQAGARVDFLDVDGPVYEFTRWRVRERGLAGRARFLFPDSDLPPTYYDSVLCVDVLEHTADPLKEFKRVLAAARKGAFFLLQFGNYLNPHQGHFRQSKERWWSKKTRRFVKKSLVPLVSGKYNYYFKKR